MDSVAPNERLFQPGSGRPLPCCINPKEDELLSSWIVRLAHRHFLKVQTFTHLLFPDVSFWNRDIDKLLPEAVIEKLGRLTLAAKPEIENTGLRSYEGSLYLSHNSNGNTKWITPLGVYHRTRKNFGLMFCPECLRKDGEDPYFRKKWRLSLSVVCVECGVYLKDRCTECMAPVVFFRTELGKRNQLPQGSIACCYRCGTNLAETESERAPKRLIAAQRMLYRVMKQGWKKEVFFPHLYFDVVYQLLNMLTSRSDRNKKLQKDLATRFRQFGPTVVAKVPGNSFDFLPVGKRTALLRQVLWLLDKDQQNFLCVSRHHRLSSSSFLRDMDYVPFWYHELVINNFFVSNVNRRFALAKQRQEEMARTVAPVNGARGPARKYGDHGHFCSRCGSDWVIRNGSRDGKRRLICRACGKNSTFAPS